MDKLQTSQAIAVMQAYVDGKQIEWRPRKYVSTCWFEMDKLSWDWSEVEYRIKPEVVKYRRYLYSKEDSYSVRVATASDFICVPYTVQAEYVEKYRGFIRWIDKDWIEETV